ncbi:peptidase S8/S53 domain-containing protein [Syncephalis fuscata]|nr:peptidase S8/S53 domain-containing protein [Syncephalis fuscata]
MEQLNQLGIIDWSEDNNFIKLDVGPPAVQLNVSSWGLDRIDQHKLPLDGVYNYPSSGGKGVYVFIMDTGVNVDHVDFGGRAVNGAILGGSAGKSPTDDQGHGTFVAGVIGGSHYGVAKNATLISVKILNKRGIGTSSDVIAGLAWILEQHLASKEKMSIINLSLGADFNRSINRAVEQIIQRGIAVVVAAGNGDENRVPQDACNFSPSSSPQVITVGATSKTDTVASFSNYGKCVTIFAPGVSITSLSSTDPAGVVTMSGTSFAAPFVTGVVALLLGEAGPLPPAEIKRRLVLGSTQGSISGLRKGDGTPNLLLYNNIDTSPYKGKSNGGSKLFDYTCLSTLFACLWLATAIEL